MRLPRTFVPVTSSWPSCWGGKRVRPSGGAILGSRIPWRLPAPERRTVSVAASPRWICRGCNSAVKASWPTAPPNAAASGGRGLDADPLAVRAQPELLGPGHRRAEEEAPVVALHRQVDGGRLQRVTAAAERAQGLPAQRHPDAHAA